RGRRPGREDAAALLVDGDLHAVDLLVVLGHLEAERAVAVRQRLDRAVQLLLDEPAHRQHRIAHALEVFVEAPRDVVTKIFDFHSRPRSTTAANSLYGLNSIGAKHDSLARKMATERAALPLPAGDGQLTVMTL